MLDNGLLKYFKDYADKMGRLNMNALPDTTRINGRNLDDMYRYHKIYEYLNNGNVFFGKSKPRARADAEILISQLYPRLGVPSAVYLPATQSKKPIVVSNNVQTEGVVPGFFVEEHLQGLLSSSNHPSKFEHITKGCVKQIALMQTLDLASYNTDRNHFNFFAHVNKNEKVDGITTIDHEMSGPGILEEDFRWYNNYFYDFFGSGFKETRSDSIQSLKQNEMLSEVVSSQELAETVGTGIDLIPRVVKEIKEETGYKIGGEYVTNLQRNFEEVAEELEQ